MKKEMAREDLFLLHQSNKTDAFFSVKVMKQTLIIKVNLQNKKNGNTTGVTKFCCFYFVIAN